MKRVAIMPLCTMFVLSCAQAEELGRLFFTPQQRAQLEREQTQAAAAGNDPAEVLRLDGIVQKSGGTRTVWLNGKMQNTDNSGESAQDTQSITVSGKTQSVRIKVGQHLLLEQVSAE